MIMPFCSKFIKKTVYQILLESPEFSRKYFKKHVGLFFGHMYIYWLFLYFTLYFLYIFDSFYRAACNIDAV